MARILIAAGLLVLGGASGGGAQETRADAIAAEQAEKAGNLKPPQPHRAQVVLDKFRGLVGADVPKGFYPAFGTIYPGGGLAVGAGYRGFVGAATHWGVHGVYSIKSYKLFEVSTRSPNHLGGRLDLDLRAGWRDAPQVAFFGLGMDTSDDDRANFRMKQAYGGVGLDFRPVRVIRLGGAVDYEDYRIEEGRGRAPSVEEVFSLDAVPALGASPTYVHAQGSASIDWRTSPGYSRRGGLYGATLHSWTDRDNVFSFERLDLDVVQHLPILRENWVFSIRGRVQTTMKDGDTVPFFLLPSLGGGSTLRGYHSWRYRDRHSMLLSAEWRWIPNRLGFDMAFFYDAGKVTNRRRDLDFDGLQGNVGIGARIHSPAATPLRLELARGREGVSIVFAGSAAF